VSFHLDCLQFSYLVVQTSGPTRRRRSFVAVVTATSSLGLPLAENNLTPLAYHLKTHRPPVTWTRTANTTGFWIRQTRSELPSGTLARPSTTSEASEIPNMARNRSRRTRRAPVLPPPVIHARPTVATRMDAKALLGRQMASIADTLAKASQRRDREVKKRSVNSSPSIAPSVPPVPPSVTSGTGSSAPGGVVVFSGRHAKPDRKAFAFGRFDLEQKGANDVMGWILSTSKVQEPLTDWCTDPTTAPRENPWGDDGDGDDAANNGSLHGSDDGDLQEMLTHLKQIDPTVGKHNEQKEDAIHSNGIDPIPYSHETDDSKAALAEPEYNPWTNGVQAEDTSDDFDLKRMLAEFDKNPIRAEDEDDDLEELLRGSRSGSSSTEKVAIDSSEGSSTAVDVIEKTTSSADDDDPRRMLADIEELSNNDPKRMLAELERMSATANDSLSGNDGDDLGALRANLSDWLSPSDGQHLPATKHQQEQLSNIQNGTKPVCPKHLVPYVIALELELSGQEWEKGLFWTEYLFSSGLNSHKAREGCCRGTSR
jgi:hypothetical protein